MISFLSPAKSLDFETQKIIGKTTNPEFAGQAMIVNKKLRSLSRRKLANLQSISSDLAALNYQRNQVWGTPSQSHNPRQAVLAFTGDVYQGLEAWKWIESDMEFANEHIRILSGLYGILKPSDRIEPYRLEMGTSLPIGRRKDLYHFWGDKLKTYLKENFGEKEVFVNLASNEYFKAVQSAMIKNPVIDVEFKDYKNGEFKIISFFAKKARGMMAGYIVKNRINDIEQLKLFDTAGYYYDSKSSADDKLVFLRTEKSDQ